MCVFILSILRPCSPGLPQTQYEAEDDFELWNFLFLPLKCGFLGMFFTTWIIYFSTFSKFEIILQEDSICVCVCVRAFVCVCVTHEKGKLESCNYFYLAFS